MNQAITFDTHRFVKHLIDGGFTEQQAELADEQVSLLNANLATKTKIANIHADIEILRQETKDNIESSHSSFLKWVFGALIAKERGRCTDFPFGQVNIRKCFQI
ncbi:MAG: hypothetical protein OXE56_11320 [Gammaproteobacteria bacterium]|nr:hypothetical protein [Gammaproteobacteria bacterium]